MICQECNERPATLHFTNFSNGEKNEIHLCEKCAKEKGEMFWLDEGPGISINNFLQGLLNIEQTFQPKSKDPFQQETVLQCERCSMTFPQFVKLGRFGCANCYDAFREQLIPVTRRLHSGNPTHKGKIPQRIGGTLQIQRNIVSLKQTLNELIAKEEFEEAVEIRDQIRSLEKSLAEKRKGGE
jgi:protein arginine kinase activator